jgi:hypothetical protein
MVRKVTGPETGPHCISAVCRDLTFSFPGPALHFTVGAQSTDRPVARSSSLTTASHLSRRRLGGGGSEAALQGRRSRQFAWFRGWSSSA